MRRPLRHAVVATTVIAVSLTGCSAAGDDTTQSSSQVPATTTEAADTGSETPTAPPGSVAVSPGGVTTAVGAPAESTEEEYSKACTAAKGWMDQRGGDPKSQIEPYLGMLQSTDSAGPGTYDTHWSQLSPARQAAVIVAVRAAADELCG